ncbi:tRNA 5-methoxyuridine(34)/uridine 5-oxyacetic acid(34) synthase CmoB [Allohahella marinimesophila]|uniref:tRNA U34 carboxymethyltransferase n=1 Tax=Allohahella marinimesophila TaxID=1054972 RepID=A0ABP7NPG1_9GAMM
MSKPWANYTSFYDRLLLPAFEALSRRADDEIAECYRDAAAAFIAQRDHGDQVAWQAAMDALQALAIDGPITSRLNDPVVSLSTQQPPSPALKEQLTAALDGLHPWRKGPFRLFDVFIDTEWHSDWKWQRLEPWLDPLKGRAILDVGCGSGYHCWRARGAGASLVVGVDPSIKFLYQFAALKHFMPDEPVFYLPMRSEDLPAQSGQRSRLFDTVLSMGVLYHRKEPLNHINELKSALRPGGQLVIETLVVDGDAQTVLMPEDRYAQMRNVWFIPSPEMLMLWLRRCGLKNVRLCDVSTTTVEEQRATPWMRFQSLRDFLSPDDPTRTIEGYPAPKRAIITATAV